MTERILRTNGAAPQLAAEALRCGIYYRVSDPKRETDGFGFAYQERNLPKNAEALGWNVVAHYKEPGISAEALHTRPQLLRALADAEKGAFDVLLAVEDTRFSRGELADWPV